MCRGYARVTLLLMWRIRLGNGFVMIRDVEGNIHGHCCLPHEKSDLMGHFFAGSTPSTLLDLPARCKCFDIDDRSHDILLDTSALATFRDHEIIGMWRWDMMSIALPQAHSAFKACRHLQSNGSACPPCQHFRKCPSETFQETQSSHTSHLFWELHISRLSTSQMLTCCI